jgi:hypothetical protein
MTNTTSFRLLVSSKFYPIREHEPNARELFSFFFFPKKRSAVERVGKESHSGPATVNDAPIDGIAFHFTGRDEELSQLHNTLRHIQDALPARCAIHGMPGIGKTQLALQYAKLQFDQGRYTHVFWISATTLEKLNQGFVKILDLVGHIDRYHQDHSSKLTSARLWLESPDRDDVHWLIVFDNVDRGTLEFLRMHLPRQKTQGSILFTTRTRDVAETLVIGRQDCTLDLPPLEVSAAMNLLLKDANVYTIDTDPSFVTKAAVDLVESVGRLPLAVAQMAAFMKQSRKTADDVLAIYKGKQRIDVSIVAEITY